MHRHSLLPILALGLAMLLGGCVVEPAGYYGYGYGHPHGYYYGGGWGYYHHDRDRW